MGEICIVKVFEVLHAKHRYSIHDEAVAVTTDPQRAEDILEKNIGGVDDSCYDYGLIVKVVNGKVYGEIDPLELKLYYFDRDNNKFKYLPYEEDKILWEVVKRNYCYID